MKKKFIQYVIIFSLLSVESKAQNVTSPYSILGIGDIESNDYGRYGASGNAAVSRREAGFYNFSNPASLTVMPYKSINFDFGFMGRASKFKLPGVDTLTNPSKDFVVKCATLAFKVNPSLAIAFGVKPYSTSNYQYTSTFNLTDGNSMVAKFADGSGGIYQSYFSIAKEIKHHFSLGITASWLFGSLRDSTIYYNPNIGLDVTRTTFKYYNAPGLQAGIQYYSKPGKAWQHAVGLTASAFTTLKGQYTANYTESGATIQTPDPQNISFHLPVSFSIGYSVFNNSGISLHLQGNYNKSMKQYLNVENSYTSDSYGFSAGMEYSNKTNTNPAIEKYYLGWGVKMQQGYVMVLDKHITDYAISFGGGKTISRLVAANGALSVGMRGSGNQGQIQENYIQFNIGITLKDFWFGTKKFGRFN
ncbi:MAG: hypothetical protein JST86_10360 [Bacteroidetes bacterium]|nr:hypothetical protein [Bacteroidota bacterium]